MPTSDVSTIWTYFASDGTAIKIGKSISPSFRLSKLQSGNPRKIELLGVAEGDHEDKLHEAFEALHLSGEWFRSDESIVTWVKEHGFVNANYLERETLQAAS